MKIRTTFAVAGCIFGITLLASAASLQGRNVWVQRRASGLLIRRVEQQLNITDEQRIQIKGILQREKPAIQALASRIQQENEELAAQPTFDDGKVRDVAREHLATTEDVLVEREKMRAEILQVLTPEQREKLQQMRQMMSLQVADRIASLGDQI